MLPLGTNQWFGTPVNPLDPALIPGGSLSGSAVAVAAGEADVALGSDTGGSIRIPAEALKAAELEVVTLDWDGFAAGTTIFTTIFLTDAWDTGHTLAHGHPDGTGDDIRQMLSMADLFRPGLDDARGQLAAWRQSLLDLFGQVDLLVLPAMPTFPPALADLAPDSLAYRQTRAHCRDALARHAAGKATLLVRAGWA